MAENEKNMNRRRFLARTAKAGLTIGAFSGAACLLYDNTPPTGEMKESNLIIPSFAVTPQDGKIICSVKAPDRQTAVNKAIDLLGGIEHFVKPGDVVFLKPNIAFASSPAIGATTNPELVAEVVKLCYARGQAKEVFIADNPINDPDSCFALSGIGKAAAAAGAKVIVPKDFYFKRITVNGASLIQDWPVFYEPLKRATKIIGIAPLKDHHRSGASMTMKNWYGLLGGRRNIFHQHIHGIISELAMMITPTLVILDGFTVMKSNGPTGGSVSDLYHANTMIVSTNQVAADAMGCAYLDLTPDRLPFIEKAAALGAGTVDFNSLKPIVAEVS